MIRRHALMIGTSALLGGSWLALAERLLADDRQILVAEGKLVLTAPASWLRKKPSSGLIEHEFAIPKAEGDEADGRLTVMGAGGTVEANIDRWLGQFRQADGAALTKDKIKLEKKTIAGQEVRLVDLAGTYLDKPGGPFTPGPPLERKGYRMLAAIISAGKLGNYFVKLYGPEKTIEAHEDEFARTIDSLQQK